MHRLGISVYPEKSTQKEVYDYLELAAKYKALKNLYLFIVSE